LQVEHQRSGLQDVLNRIFRTDAKRLPGIRAWLRKRVFSLGLVLAIGFLLIVSMTRNTNAAEPSHRPRMVGGD
jgi:uncharacterized BrkB/YihY/UPF0761 family membrane protein